MYHNIVLIGMMGSGKSSVGHCISQQHGLPFIDTDTLIETKIQMSIRDFFAAKGESAFRDEEARCCQRIHSYKNHVIATGGGIVLAKANRDALKKLGMVVYLRASPEQLCLRLEEDQTRPILNTPDKRAKIEEILLFRDALYRETAHVIVDTQTRPESIASHIWALYQSHPIQRITSA